MGFIARVQIEIHRTQGRNHITHVSPHSTWDQIEFTEIPLRYAEQFCKNITLM